MKKICLTVAVLAACGSPEESVETSLIGEPQAFCIYCYSPPPPPCPLGEELRTYQMRARDPRIAIGANLVNLQFYPYAVQTYGFLGDSVGHSGDWLLLEVRRARSNGSGGCLWWDAVGATVNLKQPGAPGVAPAVVEVRGNATQPWFAPYSWIEGTVRVVDARTAW